jgi:hypothetical protein
MELFSDTIARTKLAFRTYTHLRVLEPKMLAWPGGEEMLTVDKEIIHEDCFMMQHCFEAFWVKNYLAEARGPLIAEQSRFLCREGGRIEMFWKISPQLMMQLGSGLFTTRKEWAYVISNLYDPADGTDGSDGSFISGHQYNGMSRAILLESKPN